MQLQEAIEGYLLFKSTQASAATIQADTGFLNQFMAWAKENNLHAIETITANEIRAYLKALADRELSPFSIKRHYALLSAFWTWLSSAEIALVPAHIVHAIPVPKEPKHTVKTLSRDDMEALLAACEHSQNQRRDRAMILFLLDSGCRATEACQIQLPDFDMHAGKVLVTGKGSKQRYVYIGKRALQACWLYLKQERPEPARNDSDHLFLTQDGYPLDRNGLRHILNRIGKRAGVRIHPHLFRHTAAIERLRRGMNLVALQHFLGHEKMETTRKYLTSLNEEDIEKAARHTSAADDWRL